MFSIFQLTTIVSIIIAFIFLIMLIQLNAFGNSQKCVLFLLVLICVITFGFDLMISFDQINWIIPVFPFYFTSLLLIYPLFYLYFRKYIFANIQITLSNFWPHLLITGFATLFLSIYYYLLPNFQKYEIIQNELISPSVSYNGIYGFRILLYSLYYLQYLFYIFLFIRLQRSLKKSNIDREQNNLPLKYWLMIFIYGTLIIETIIVVASNSFPSELYKLVEQLISLIFIIFIGILATNQSKLLIQVRIHQATLQAVRKTHNIQLLNIAEDEKSEIKRLIVQIIKEKKLYLNPDLKIDDLAKKVHYPVKKMSQVIHEVYNRNFSNFINEYRIQEAISLLNQKYQFSIEEICIKTGFNSRSTFNRAFKTVTSLTPRDYLNQLNGHSSES